MFLFSLSLFVSLPNTIPYNNNHNNSSNNNNSNNCGVLIIGTEGGDPADLDTVQPVRETVFSSEICSVEVSTSPPEQGGTILFDDIGKIIFLLASSQTKIAFFPSVLEAFLLYFASKILPCLVHPACYDKPFEMLNFRRIENFSIKLQL